MLVLYFYLKIKEKGRDKNSHVIGDQQLGKIEIEMNVCQPYMLTCKV